MLAGTGRRKLGQAAPPPAQLSGGEPRPGAQLQPRIHGDPNRRVSENKRVYRHRSRSEPSIEFRGVSDGHLPLADQLNSPSLSWSTNEVRGSADASALILC